MTVKELIQALKEVEENEGNLTVNLSCSGEGRADKIYFRIEPTETELTLFITDYLY